MMFADSDPSGFCVLCGHKMDDLFLYSSCPKCGEDGRPCKTEDQVEISVNCYELRLLFLWAELLVSMRKRINPATNTPDIFYSMVNRIKRQLPEEMRDKWLLTAVEDFQYLKDNNVKFVSNNPVLDTPELSENYNPNLHKDRHDPEYLDGMFNDDEDDDESPGDSEA